MGHAAISATEAASVILSIWKHGAYSSEVLFLNFLYI